MITPLKMDMSIDWDGVDRLTDWYIDFGVAGLFAVGQSSEMFALSDGERLRLAARVVRRADGRVPIVASGTFDRTVAAQAQFVRQMADLGVTQVVLIASMMAELDDDDTIWRSNVSRLLDATGDIPLGLYECPQPYHRLVSADLVAWAAGTGRFCLLKETSRSLSQVRAKPSSKPCLRTRCTLRFGSPMSYRRRISISGRSGCARLTALIPHR